MNTLAPDIAALSAQVEGPVLTDHDAGYAAETAAWNQALTHRPLVAIGVTSVADVQAAVRFAGAHGVPIAVVATGHGAVVSADGAVLVSTRRLRAVHVDALGRTARRSGERRLVVGRSTPARAAPPRHRADRRPGPPRQRPAPHAPARA